MNQGVKTNLAKLLATENLVVEHANVETASFDVVNRVLTLPIWEASEGVYDMLVGHEVGHALYTPNDLIDESLPCSYVNVVEDARIERMIKSTYPGLIKSFSGGYKELGDKDFFDIEDKNLNEFNLIDRINLHFKLGIHDVTTVIPFKKDEERFVEATRNTVTFDDVCKVAREIHEYMQEKKIEKQVKLPDEIDINESSPMNTDSQIDVDTEDKIDSDEESKSEEKDVEEWMDEAEDEMYEDEMDVRTEESFSRNQKKLLSSETWTTINPPVCNFEDYITSNDILIEDMKSLTEELKDKMYYPYNWHTGREEKELLIKKWTRELNEYKLSSKKEVNYLVKEFECRKAASNYNRSATSRTGVLDTKKLHSYRYNEDLFKKVTTFADGKNHGLLMFVDWSGSMHTNLLSTVKLLLNIVQFCKKVNIPFEVYSFVENRYHDSKERGKYYSKCSDKKNTVCVSDGYHLIQLLDSTSKVKLDNQITAVWTLVNSVVHDYIRDLDGGGLYEMGGTPLNETIFAATYLYKKFCKKTKVEKVNTIFLTDGESNHLTCNRERVDSRDGSKWISHSQLGWDGSCVSFRDPKSGYQQHKLVDGSDFYSNWSVHSLNVTAKLMQYYRWLTGSNVVGYRLCQEKPTSIQRAASLDKDEFHKIWRKTGYAVVKELGYNELYIIKMNKSFTEVEEMNANSSSTNSKLRNEFKKHIKSKGFHKILLSKFVEQIA